MLIRYLIINLLLISALFAGYFDTGYIQWEQPDGTKFTARLWGDEFENYMQTRDGHNIIIGKDECYYFAALSTDGIPVPTEKIVGIHEPDLQSYQLNQSAGIKTNPDQRAAFNEQLRLNGISYKQIKEKTTTGAVTINLGVILVDFTPSRRYKSDPHGNFPNGYQKHYFDELIFSENYWNGEPQAPLFETPHPENHALFGSLQDYYWQQSRGQLALSGKEGQPKILNSLDPAYPNDAVPQWLQLPRSFGYYNGHGFKDFFADVTTAFEAAFPNISLNDYQNYIIIYGGNFSVGMLTPKTISKYFIVSERTPAPRPFFTHVGVYAHEFGHQLGAFDEYRHQSPDQYDPLHWSLMAQGEWNGEEVGTFFNNAACPAGFSPYYRILWGWVDPIYLGGTNYENFVIRYDYQNPRYYRLDIPGSEEYLVLENRLRDGFDRYTPYQPDYIPVDHGEINGNQGGLLIWHIAPNAYPGAYGNTLSDIVELEFADQSNAPGADEVGDPFPYDQNDLHSSGLNFNDNTLPSSKLRDGVTSSGIAIDNITWDTAYNTVAVDILRNYGVGTIIHSDTVWSGAPVIDQNVHVMGGVTLTVQAGTEVSFESGKGVILMPGSRLNVPGSKNQPVVFQSTDSTSNPWQGILVKGPGALLNFRHVIIRDADKAIRVKKRFELTLENITFINNQYALDVRNENKEALIQFAKCKFRESKIDILNTNNKKVQLAISHCIFENSKLSSFNNHLQLINNTFIGTSQISSRQDILILKNNIFYGMTEHLNIGSPPEIYEIQYNCFSSLANQERLYLNQPGNFSADPQFVDEQMGEYHLLPTSPCIDAGDPEADYSQEPVSNGGRINLGCYGNTAEAATTVPKNPSTRKKPIVTPQAFELFQNYPNPFNPSTTISYQLAKAGKVELTIYNISGQKVKTLVHRHQPAGSYEFDWDGRNENGAHVSSGVYLYRLKTGTFVQTRKMTLLR